MSGRIIDTAADVAEGLDWLTAREPAFGRALETVGAVPLRRRPGGFGGLMWIITGQQVSTASAAAIWGRIEAAGLTARRAVAAASDEDLRAVGLSRPKQRYARALAAAEIDFAGLAALSDDAVVARLTALPGIGRWSAEIYAGLCLGRADVLAAGDLALQEAARDLFGLPVRPDAAALRALAAGWSPWRGVAARLLWAYYRVQTKREGMRE